MLSLSVHKKLDYSTPILFIPLGVQTTKTKLIPVKKITPVAAKPATSKKTIPIKPTTVAAVIPKKVNPPKITINNSIAVADVKKIEPIKADVKVEPKIEKQEKLVQQKENPQEKSPSFEPSSAKASEARQAFTTEQSRSIRTSGGDIAQALDIQQTITPVIPENAHISNNYRQVEALRMQAQLQKEIVQKWKPPIGVSPDCTCDVSFFVNTNGGVENIKMAKASGVMMFDISARQALCAIKMPHWTYGKILTITFKE